MRFLERLETDERERVVGERRGEARRVARVRPGEDDDEFVVVWV